MMELTDQQKQSVERWVNDGLGLSDVQKKLADEFDVRMTYMDVRFLVLDLGLELQDTKGGESASPAEDVALSPDERPDEERPTKLSPEADGLPSKVSIEVDRLMKPGSLVSGSVTFSDGVTATWMLDQIGRLALQPSTPDYKPSDEDVAAFQESLRDELAKKGF